MNFFKKWLWKAKILRNTEFEVFIAKLNTWLAEAKMIESDKTKMKLEKQLREFEELREFAKKNEKQEKFGFYGEELARNQFHDKRNQLDTQLKNEKALCDRYTQQLRGEELVLANKEKNLEFSKRYFKRYCQ